MSKLAEAYARHKHPKAKSIKGTYFSYGDLGNCYSHVNIRYEIDGKSFDEQLKLDEFFEFIGGALTQSKEVKSSSEEAIKKYLKDNLKVKVWAGYSSPHGNKKIEVQILLDGEVISESNTSNNN